MPPIQMSTVAAERIKWLRKQYNSFLPNLTIPWILPAYNGESLLCVEHPLTVGCGCSAVNRIGSLPVGILISGFAAGKW